jgi:hypothetical protein
MSEAEDPATPAQKPGLAVRAFLIVLPVGLAFMVPISLWIYYKKKYQPEPATSQYAAVLRRDLNADDFTRYARILAQDIGDRSLANPDNLDAAAKFIESTMDFANMGYAVKRQAFEAQGKPVVNLVAELPGKSKPREIVWVFASYDAADASGVSALMCVAHALTGSEHARTVRFAAVMEEAGGVAQLRKAPDGSDEKTHAVISVAPSSQSLAGKLWEPAQMRPFSWNPTAAPDEILERLRDLQRLIEQSADAP